MAFDRRFEQVLLGSLCGDGSICRFNSTPKTMYREGHTYKQKDYLIWKINLFSKYFNFHVYNKKGYNKKTNKTYRWVQADTNCDFRFNYYYHLIYPKKSGFKLISNQILKKLNWLGIAVWFCDDGSYSYSHNSIRITTNKKYHKLIINYFKIKGFNIYSNKNDLIFNARDSRIFLKRVRKYILKMPKSMHYKIGLDKKKKLKALRTSRRWRKQYFSNPKVVVRQKHLKHIWYLKHKEVV